MKIILTGASGFIGTNLMSTLIDANHELLNLDISQASNQEHEPYRVNIDIMDGEALSKSVTDFQPDVFIHLAARTDCDENTTVEAGYQANVEGVENVLEAVKNCPAIARLIMTSTQYVCGPGRLPEHDEDYYPHTVYGQSKVKTEKLTREANLECDWVIVRPVNIWGPYHERYSREFWKIADKGLYLHPGVPSPTRTYGYVENVVWQIIQIVKADRATVDKQVFYVGDRPINIEKWVMGVCVGFRGKKPRVIPMWMMRLMGKVGDLISKFTGKPFYITSSRLRSMTEDYDAPMDKTFDVFGAPPHTLEQGINETVEWYRSKK